MEGVFLQVLNMSFTGGVVILLVLLARLLLRKAPRVYSYALWSVALFRLLCPVSLNLGFSLLPVNSQPVSRDLLTAAAPAVQTGWEVLDRQINRALPVPAVGDSVNPLQVWATVGAVLWAAGAAAFLVWSVVSLVRLRRRLRDAQPEGENIWVSGKVGTAFVLGIFRPRIYLPQGLTEQEREYILLHEKTHLRRLDHVWRLAAFLALCVHWFNPLVWAAFFLSGRDMEMSCDEAVVKKLGNEVKKPYSASLLALSCGRRGPLATPLAFGEGQVKERVQNVLRCRKPALWVTLTAGTAVAALVIGLAVNGGESGKISVEFPAYQDGKNAANAFIYETEPFRLLMELPEGWTVAVPAESDRIAGEPWTSVEVRDAGGKKVGIVGFEVFDDIPEVSQEDGYKLAFQGLRGGSMVSWCEAYTPVKSEGAFESAVSELWVSGAFLDPDSHESTAAAERVTHLIATAYDREMGVAVAMALEPDSVTEEELVAMAGSMELQR